MNDLDLRRILRTQVAGIEVLIQAEDRKLNFRSNQSLDKVDKVPFSAPVLTSLGNEKYGLSRGERFRVGRSSRNYIGAAGGNCAHDRLAKRGDHRHFSGVQSLIRIQPVLLLVP